MSHVRVCVHVRVYVHVRVRVLNATEGSYSLLLLSTTK
jgi:hypothetical protein